MANAKSPNGSARIPLSVPQVHDIAEPNLLREMFPYHAVPKIEFDGAIEALDPAPEFFITDTTFRDGQQARPPTASIRLSRSIRCCIDSAGLTA